MKNIVSKLALAILFISMWSCGETSSEEKTEEKTEEHSEEENHIELTNEQLKNTEIEIGKAEMRSLGSEISVNGIIDVPPQGNISINIPYGGFLKYTEMLPGTKVKKGQLLAVIENPMFIDIQQQYLETLAEGEYLKTDFVKLDKSIDSLKHKIVEGSTEILCLKEESFDLVLDSNKKNRIKIFQNQSRYTAILFDLFYFEEFIEQLKKLKDKPVSVYVFSYTKDFSKEEFGDLGIKFTIEPIPEKILETYKKIFNF